MGFTAKVDERVDLLGDAHRAELGGHGRPARAVIISAVNTGRQLAGQGDARRRTPTQRSCWNMRRAPTACRAETAPAKKPDQHDDGQRAHPHELHLLEEQPRAERGRNSAAAAWPSILE